jgi:peptidoglycan/xylan/chitin deacetylase (PgdA/CDA1 family)
VEVVTDERDFVRRAMSIRPDVFERQLVYLREKGYTFITLDELSAAAANQGALPEKPIILTFDDGYRDFYTEAWPILERHQIKATVFVVANFIGKDANYMDEPQIQELVSSGLVEIGSHTLSHRYLTSMETTEAEKEIGESKRLLEERFGVAVNHFAYPGGYNNADLAQVVAAAGYSTAVGTQKGEATNGSDLYHLPRLRVGNLSPAELLAILAKNAQ